jgi:succinyl-CoA synthetase beta subunit
VLLFEYESKQILREHGIPTPKGVTIVAGDDVAAALQGLPGPYMVKAQILAGGRRKAGGVLAAETPAEANAVASRLYGNTIKGHRVATLLVEEKVPTRSERYLAILLDGEDIVCLVGSRGGTDVEAYFSGEKGGFRVIKIDPVYGLGSYQMRAALESLGIAPAVWPAFSSLAGRLYEIFTTCDAILAEVNPIGELADGSLIALDARISIDDGALYRQPRFAALDKKRILDDSLLSRMKELEIQYVPVGGSIGLVSSGAGVGVTIMDWVAHEGGKIAAFVDLDYAILSGRTKPGLELVLQHFLDDPNVRSIIVNFTTCGIRLDQIAESLLAVLQEHGGNNLPKPLYLHLQGNRAAIAHRMLQDAGFAVCDALGDAVRRATQSAKEATA